MPEPLRAHESGPASAAPAAIGAEARFGRRALLVAALVVLAMVIWRLSPILVLAFGSVLLSLILRGLAKRAGAALGAGERISLAAIIVLLIAALGLVAWLFGSQLGAQFEDLAERLPQTTAKVIALISNQPMGQYLLAQAQALNLTNATSIAASGIEKVTTIASHGIGYSVLILFAGIYIAVDPGRYRKGALSLVPPRRRPRAEAFLDQAAGSLERWVLAQLMVMLLVGVLISFGLWLLGVRAAFALGLIDGLFTFVPIIGPIAASILAMLMALAQAPILAVYTLILFLAVHMIEGNLITPLVQSRAATLPPVVTLFAALSFGLLLGPLAVLFAAPLAVTMLVAFRTLYIEDVLGEAQGD